MSARLTERQRVRYEAAEAKLPEGYYYALHSEPGDHVWGVTVGHDSLDGGICGEVNSRISAFTTCADERIHLVRLLLNRAASALWHRQPTWKEGER